MTRFLMMACTVAGLTLAGCETKGEPDDGCTTACTEVFEDCDAGCDEAGDDCVVVCEGDRDVCLTACTDDDDDG